jgi:hypothetical protein
MASMRARLDKAYHEVKTGDKSIRKAAFDAWTPNSTLRNAVMRENAAPNRGGRPQVIPDHVEKYIASCPARLIDFSVWVPLSNVLTIVRVLRARLTMISSRF